MSEEDGAPLTVWIGLSVIAILSFYCQAAVTEERFVPALNVIAIEFGIPDDVAGATLMAAGASSPELFSSIVALFITHSALGLGTVVGSEIFNQLIICAGAIFASSSGTLELDRAVVSREIFFYALSISLLLFALHDIEPTDDDDKDHIFISFFDACVLFAAYICYVLVCANFDTVLKCFSRRSPEEFASVGQNVKRQQFDKLDNMPFVRVGAGNKDDKVFHVTKGGEKRGSEKSAPDETTRMLRAASSSFSDSRRKVSTLEKTMKYTLGRFSEGSSLRMFSFSVEDNKPSDEHELYDIQINTFQEEMSLFLWQRSYFYNKSKFATKGWNLRWFTFRPTTLSSVPDRANSFQHRIIYPHFKEIDVDEDRLIIRIINPDPTKRNYYLMAPSHEILDAAVRQLEKIIQGTEGQASEEDLTEERADDVESHGSLLDFPHGGTNTQVAFHVILFPLKALMHYTIPDVRVLNSHGVPMTNLKTAFMASFMCLGWLIVGSYAMVASLEGLGDLLDIPDAVIGVTVSAAGTSLPNYIASKVAAEKGFGNMAVSNAFGSNTFNILVALGLPWLLYTSFGTHFQPYHELRNEGILESVIILSGMLGIFVVIVVTSGFKLYRWHAYLFVFLYVAYLTLAIGQVYLM